MRIADKWKDYSIIATGDGMKLERWGSVYLLRPDPQVIWRADKPLTQIRRPDARYIRSQTGGGRWEASKPLGEWVVGWRELKFKVKPMGFKHTGLFPEQAENWEFIFREVRRLGAGARVLNLFAYTGGASLAARAAGADVTGASVCHVDSARNMVERARENMELSGLSERPVRYIVDDCKKFVRREINRGRRYDALIMDPPSYGRGPNGELWKIEEDLYDFVELCSGALEKTPLFVLINSYTTGLQPAVLKNILTKFFGDRGGRIEAYEVCLPTDEEGIVLPCGASGLFRSDKAEKR